MKTTNSRQLLLGGIFCVVFFGLPLFLIWIAIANHVEYLETTEKRNTAERFEKLKSSLQNPMPPKDFFKTLLSECCRKISESSDPKKKIEKWVSVINRRFPDIFSIFAINSKLEFLFPEIASRSEIASATILYNVLMKSNFVPSDKKRQFFLEEWDKIKDFIGKYARPNEIDKNILIDVGGCDKNRYFYSFVDEKIAFFVRLNKTINWNQLPLLDSIIFFNRRFARKKIEATLIPDELAKISDPALRSAVNAYSSSEKGLIERGGKLFHFFETSSGELLKISCPSLQKSSNLLSFFYILFYTIFLALSTGFFLFSVIKGNTFKSSLKLRISVLFIFASVLPLLAIAASCQNYLEWRNEERLIKSYSKLKQYLYAIESGFPWFLGSFERHLGKIFKKSDCDSPESKQMLVDKILNIKKLFDDGSGFGARIIDEKGKIIWELEVGAKNNPLDNVLGKLCSYELSNLNNEKGSFVEQFLVSFIESISSSGNFVTEVSRNLGKVICLKIDDAEKWSIFLPIFSKTGRATHIILLVMSKGDFNLVYLKKRLRKSYFNFYDSFCVSQNARGFPNNFPKRKFSKGIELFFKGLSGSRSFTTRQIPDQGGLLLAGILSRELLGRNIVVALPDCFLKREKSSDKNRLILFGTLCVCLAIFIGYILTRRILTPLENLTIGVKAIGNRNFALRLPCDNSDELQEIALTFNSAMEGMADLEVGRIVQENLFPHNETLIGNFSIYGETRSASCLGGDYFDIISLDETHALIIIGDVTGHGLGAALIMAMAKAIVGPFLKLCSDAGKFPQPIEMQEYLAQAMFRNLKSKRMMTLMIALLDTNLETLFISNAGHNFPCLFRKNNPPKIVQLNDSLPQSNRKRSTFRNNELKLQSGDRVLFYTDGLVEAKDTQNQVLGYEKTFQNLAEFHGKNAKQTFDLINHWHKSMVKEEPQEDDITMIMLQKRDI
ncbi:MAG: SpoIIE family protein phosphatase [Candidatus Riflebacteria bacterium]|nr:SpoIIE family protein phosphatase [Candidatus Riflebacteria bacterium]